MAGSIRRRGTNSFELTFDAGVDLQTGKRIRRFLTVKGTRKEAERTLTEALHLRDTGIDLVPSKVTVAEYLARWQTDYAQHNVAKSTLAGYASIIVKLNVKLGPIRLQALRPNHVQSAYSEYLTAGLSPTTVLAYHRVLHEALSHAVKWQLVFRNVADAVTPPRASRREMRALSHNDAVQLLKAAAGTDLATLILFTLHTGMRQGEILALRWSDVDLTMAKVQVQRSARYYPGEGVVIGPTKTHRSQRQIALAADTVLALREHKRAQNEARLLLGPKWHDEDLVFPGPDGRSLPARNLFRAFTRLVTTAELGQLRFHDLRHTAATLMLRAGINAKMVSERLGHATTAFTMDRYAHALPDMQLDAAERLAESLRLPA